MKTKQFEAWLIPKDIKPNWSGQVVVNKIETRKLENGTDWEVLSVIMEDGQKLFLSGWALRGRTKRDNEILEGDKLELFRTPSNVSVFVYQKLAKVVEEDV